MEVMEKNEVATVKKSQNTFAQALGASALVMLFSSSAMAADNITSLGTDASANLSAALTVALAIFAVGIGIVGTFKGYAYLKSGVNKA